ncbi:MAG: Sec-independent protein translocase protein TatB [Pseudomonadota bacterium]
MLDIGWQELLVIGALALIVVGPKDLPSLLRSVGQWVGRVRGMARDFQRAMTDAARETEMSAFKDLQDIRKINPLDDFKKQAENAQSFLNGSGDAPEKKTEVAEASEPAADPEPVIADTGSTEPAPAETPPMTDAAAEESVPKAATR